MTPGRRHVAIAVEGQPARRNGARTSLVRSPCCLGPRIESNHTVSAGVGRKIAVKIGDAANIDSHAPRVHGDASACSRDKEPMGRLLPPAAMSRFSKIRESRRFPSVR